MINNLNLIEEGFSFVEALELPPPPMKWVRGGILYLSRYSPPISQYQYDLPPFYEQSDKETHKLFSDIVNCDHPKATEVYPANSSLKSHCSFFIITNVLSVRADNGLNGFSTPFFTWFSYQPYFFMRGLNT